MNSNDVLKQSTISACSCSKSTISNEQKEIAVLWKKGLFWKQSVFLLENKGYRICEKSKYNPSYINNLLIYDLSCAILIDLGDDDVSNQHELAIRHLNRTEHIFRFDDISNKISFINKINEVIDQLNRNITYSLTYKEKEMKLINDSEFLGKKEHLIFALGNLILELNQKVNDLNNCVKNYNSGKQLKKINKARITTLSFNLDVISNDISEMFEKLKDNLVENNNRKDGNNELIMGKQIEKVNDIKENTNDNKENKKQEQQNINIEMLAHTNDNNNNYNIGGKGDQNNDEFISEDMFVSAIGLKRTENSSTESLEDSDDYVDCESPKNDNEQILNNPFVPNKNISNISNETDQTKDTESISSNNNKNKNEIQTQNLFSNKSNEVCLQCYLPKNKRTFLPFIFKPKKNALSQQLSNILQNDMILPMETHEPLTQLQRQCELLINKSLLIKASSVSNQNIQICYVGAFLMASLSLNINRFLNPLDSLLGETFEYFDIESHTTFFSEKVSNDPNIMAFIFENPKWILYGDSSSKRKFKLLKGGIDIEYKTKYHLTFKNTSTTYLIQKPNCVLKNCSVENYGTIEITNTKDPLLKLTIILSNNKKKTQIGSFEGKVMYNKQLVYYLRGNYHNCVYICNPDLSGRKCIWEIKDEKYLNNSLDEYAIPQESCDYNNLTPELEKALPKTDSRFRPDLREYEKGNLIEAGKIKAKLEEEEKKRQIEFEKKKTVFQSYYFNQIFDQDGKEKLFIYKGGYWEEKEKNNFSILNKDLFKFSSS